METTTKRHPTTEVLTRIVEAGGFVEGVHWCQSYGEGAVLYTDTTGERISHLFNAEGLTYVGAYSGSGDNVDQCHAERVTMLARRDL